MERDELDAELGKLKSEFGQTHESVSFYFLMEYFREMSLQDDKDSWVNFTVICRLLYNIFFLCMRVEAQNKTDLTAVEPAGKTSLLSICILTKLTRQYNGKWPISLSSVSKPLITVVTAVNTSLKRSVEIAGVRSLPYLSVTVATSFTKSEVLSPVIAYAEYKLKFVWSVLRGFISM